MIIIRILPLIVLTLLGNISDINEAIQQNPGITEHYLEATCIGNITSNDAVHSEVYFLCEKNKSKYYFISSNYLFELDVNKQDVKRVKLSNEGHLIEVAYNPATDSFVIHIQCNNQYIIISYDLSGEKLWEQKIAQRIHIIPYLDGWLWASDGYLHLTDKGGLNRKQIKLSESENFIVKEADETHIGLYYFETDSLGEVCWNYSISNWSGEIEQTSPTNVWTQNVFLAETEEGDTYSIGILGPNVYQYFNEFGLYVTSYNGAILKISDVEIPLEDVNGTIALTAGVKYENMYYVFGTVMDSEGNCDKVVMVTLNDKFEKTCLNVLPTEINGQVVSATFDGEQLIIITIPFSTVSNNYIARVWSINLVSVGT